jgi:GT2 family glycosyltransferase
MQKKISISVIIPTINIDSLTIKCVSTTRAFFPEANIYVISDLAGNEDKIRNMAIIFITGPITISAKRNIGAIKSKDEILAFIDSDAFPSCEWLNSASRGFQEHAKIVALAGPNMSPPNEGLSELIVGKALQSRFCVLNAHLIKRKGNTQIIQHAPSCNFLIRRSAYLDLGGMDETLFGGEDLEFCNRLTKNGGEILYIPEVLVFHKNRNLKAFMKQRIAYGAFVVNQIHNNPGFYNIIPSLPALFILFILSGIFIPFLTHYKFLYFSVLGIYLTILIIESIRFSTKIRYIPGVLLAMVIATIFPGFGYLAELAGKLPEYRKFYRNDD